MNELTLRQLEYAVAVADHGHFGRAAESVFVSQPGLSSQVRELESRLGVTLFERGNRGILITPEGEDLIERARRILVGVDELVVAAAAGGETLSGRLRIGVIPTMAPYLLPGLVRMIGELWPGVSLELTETQTADMVDAIEGGRLDLGLLATPIETGSLVVTDVANEAFFLALPLGHRLAGEASVPLAVLRDLPTLIMEEGHCLREHVLTACEVAGATEQSEVISASLSTLIQMVVGGSGVTLLPESALALETGGGSRVATVRFSDPAPGRTISLVWRSTDPRSAYFSELAERYSYGFSSTHRDH